MPAPHAAPQATAQHADQRWRSHFAQHGLSPDSAVARRSIFAAQLR